MHNFTPFASLLGGVLIGLSASALLLLDGKIAGISGILAGVLKPVKDDWVWRACFLAGLFAGGCCLESSCPALSTSASFVRSRCSHSRGWRSGSAPGWAADAPADTECAA